MKTLGVKFSDTQVLKIKDLSEVVGINASQLSRAAMLLGVNQIRALAARDLDKAIDLVLINLINNKDLPHLLPVKNLNVKIISNYYFLSSPKFSTVPLALIIFAVNEDLKFSSP